MFQKSDPHPAPHPRGYQYTSILVYWCIGLGILLRFLDLSFPDFDTDEAQAAFAATAAWTPAGMMTFRFAQALFGQEIIIVRGTSALFGLAFLPLFYALARRYVDRPTALTAVAVAALFPSHILFSRLGYLSTQLLFAWTLLLYCFLKVCEVSNDKATPRSSTKSSGVGWFAALFFASVYATFIKTQGLVLPILLAVGVFIDQWRTQDKFSIFWTLLLSLIPVSLYILTHPGIAATLLLYEGNLYGVSDFLTRVSDLLRTYWHVLSLFLLAIVFSLRSFPACNWPLRVTLAWVSMHGLFLGPGNAYYTTELVLFALPIGVSLARLSPLLRNTVLCILLITTLTLLGPRSLFLNRWTLEPFRSEPYWNTHANIINEHVRDETAVTVFGYPGHQLRWYLEPRALVGRTMVPPYPTRHLLILQDPVTARRLGSVIYEDEKAVIVRQQE